MIMKHLLSLLSLFVAVFAYPNKKHQRIIGGDLIDIKDVPYQVSIRGINERHDCGGSIISTYYVVTAAHCLDYWDDLYNWAISIDKTKTPSDFFGVRVGASKLENDGKTYGVKNWTIHEGYNTTMILSNDIALIELEDPIEFDDNQRPINFLNATVPRANEMAVASGWGKFTMNDDTLSPKLRSVRIPIVDKDTCVSNYQKLHENQKLPMDGEICAGSDGKSTCNGDSGGPLVIKSILIGIVSWSKSCAEPEYPEVFTSVYHYRDWILRHMKNLDGIVR